MAIDKIECDVGHNNFCCGYHWFWNAPYLILTSKKFNLKMHSLSSVVDTELGPNCIRDWNKSRRKYIEVGILLWILQDLSCWCLIIPWWEYGGRAWPAEEWGDSFSWVRSEHFCRWNTHQTATWRCRAENWGCESRVQEKAVWGVGGLG